MKSLLHLALALALTPNTPNTPWDTAFHDTSGATPIHFTAHYRDCRGATHRLEEWRIGQGHLRRKTDDRIDLHADADPTQARSQPLTYTWRIVDLQKHIDHRVSTAGMMHLGMLYSYYSMAHLLTRPAGAFTVSPAKDPTASAQMSSAEGQQPSTPPGLNHQPCTWWQIDAPGQASTRVCWIPAYGLPARIDAQTPQGWRLTFQVDTLDTHPIAPATFNLNPQGLQVRDVDKLESED